MLLASLFLVDYFDVTTNVPCAACAYGTLSFDGGPERIRTPGLLSANEAL